MSATLSTCHPHVFVRSHAAIAQMHGSLHRCMAQHEACIVATCIDKGHGKNVYNNSSTAQMILYMSNIKAPAGVADVMSVPAAPHSVSGVAHPAWMCHSTLWLCCAAAGC